HIVDDMTRAEDDAGRDYNGIEARLFDFLSSCKSKNYVAYFSHDEFPEKDLKARREALKGRVQQFVERAGADLVRGLGDELSAVFDECARRTERAGCRDFLDLQLRARDMVRDNAAVRAELQTRFTRVFVDEFQDTDPLQAEILMLLSADN